MHRAHFDYEGKKFVGISSHQLQQGEVVSVQLDNPRQVTFLRIISVTPSGVNGDVTVRASKVNTGANGSMTISVSPEKGGEKENGAPK